MRRCRRLRSLLTALVVELGLFGFGMPLALAQGPTTGSVTGVVTDNTSGVVPGVTVTAVSPSQLGALTSVTGAQGQYRFPSLSPGVYKLTFELPGFTTVVRDGIVSSLGQTAQVNVTISVASVQETVTVTGASPVVDAQNTKVTNNFTAEMLRNIPNARDIWSLIAEAPGMTVSRFDVGGSAAGTQTGYTSYGASGQNRVQVDGANTTEGTDAAGFYFDYGAFDEVSFGASSAADAQMPTPGVLVNTVLKSGGNQIHGDGYFDYENGSLQGDNMTPKLKALGVGTTTRFKTYMDPNVNLGGPIVRDKFWYFTSIRSQEIKVTIGGWPYDDPGHAPDYLTRLQNVTYKLSYQLNPSNKITHFLQWGRKYQPYRNADATMSLDSVYAQDSYSWAGKVEWNHIHSSTFFFDARASTFGYNWPNLPYTPDMKIGSGSEVGYRRTDTVTGNTAGGYSGYRYDRRRYQGEIVANYYRDNWLGGNHSLKFGWLSELESYENEQLGARDSIELTFNSPSAVDFTTPYRVALRNLPTTALDKIWHHGTFIQDQITVSPKVTINVGLRWDYYNTFEPEQAVRDAPFRDFFYGGVPLQTSAGPYSLPRSSIADTWKVPARKGIIVLKNTLAPRAGVAWDLAGNGKTVVKVNFGRFYSNPGASTSSNGNPIQSTTANFNWNDQNGDRLFSLNELGSFVNTSGGTANLIEPNIKPAYTNEANLFFERQLVTDLGLRFGFVWKRQGRQWDQIDLARPRDLWTRIYTIADPGVDGIAGTADDGPSFTAYGISLPTVPATRNQTTARDDNKQSYKNIDVTLNKRMSNRWSLIASALYTWQNESYYGAPQNPNEDINNYTHTKLWSFKLFGSYQAPWGITVSPVLRHQAGTPIPRRVVASTNAGTFNILVEPSGAYRQDNVTIFDTRLEKQFRFGNNRRLSAFLDLFNLTNSSAAQNQESITGRRTVTVDGVKTTVARFEYPTTVISPRIVRIGVRFMF